MEGQRALEMGGMGETKWRKVGRSEAWGAAGSRITIEREGVE